MQKSVLINSALLFLITILTGFLSLVWIGNYEEFLSLKSTYWSSLFNRMLFPSGVGLMMVGVLIGANAIVNRLRPAHSSMSLTRVGGIGVVLVLIASLMGSVIFLRG